ncbi:unnamed protein product [Ectocarpus sp. 12 AP-2014]
MEPLHPGAGTRIACAGCFASIVLGDLMSPLLFSSTCLPRVFPSIAPSIAGRTDGRQKTSVCALDLWQDGVVWAAMGAAGFGLSMASTYPLAMSLLPEAGYALSEKNSSRFVVGGALGEMLVPACIALLLGPSSSSGNSIGDGDGEPGRSDALYGACFAISLLLVAVYGTWYGLLASSVATAAASSSPLRYLG